MSRGRRYEEPKLNLKKVFAVIIAIAVVIMFVFIIKGILGKGNEQGKITSESYFAAFKDNKWGIINSTGNAVIDPSYQEMIVVPNSKKDVFLCTYDVNYDTGDYKTKVLNSKNEEIFKDYDKVEAIQNADEKGKVWYEENVLKVQKSGKYGLINLDGKELIQCEYDEITSIQGIKSALKVKKDNKYGVVTNEGKSILNVEYADITNLGTDNKSGYIIKNEDGKYGIVDYSNTKILEAKYDKIEKIYGNDMYVVVENGKQKLVKKDATEVLTTGFDEIKQILATTESGIIYVKNNKYGLMDLEGNIKIKPEYDSLEETKTGILIAKQNNKYGIIDIENNEKIEFKYTSIIYNKKADMYIAEDETFNNNIIDNTFSIKQTGILIDIDDEKGYFELRQNDEYKYYNFKFEEKNVADIFTSNTLFLKKQNGKYGFVDKTGNTVVDYIYDDATEQNAYGYVSVKKDGKWGSLDNKGNTVVEPTYNLEDYLKIDFIGKWHFGKDINMNYYNQQ